MPRYQLRTAPMSDAARRHAAEVAARRYPEVDIVACDPQSAAGRDVWVCRAPDASHVERWATATALQPVEVDLLVTETPNPREEPQ